VTSTSPGRTGTPPATSWSRPISRRACPSRPSRTRRPAAVWTLPIRTSANGGVRSA